MSLRLWTIISISFLCIALVAFAFVARKPLCIDSILVERIDRVSEDGSATAFRCGLRRHVPFDQFLFEKQLSFSKRLQTLERVFEWVGELNSKVHITVFQGRPHVYKIHGQDLFISEEILEKHYQLEKSIIKLWFRERAHSSLLKHPLIEEVYSDTFLYLWLGDLNLEVPEGGVYLSQLGPSRWPRILKSWGSYCRSPWKINEHLQICEKSPENSNHLALEAMRPFLTQSLIGAINSLSATERVGALKKWAELIKTWEFSEFSLESKTSYNDLYEFAKKFIQSLDTEDNGLFFQNLALALQDQMLNRGYSEPGPSTIVDLMIFKNELTESDRLVVSSLSSAYKEQVISGLAETNLYLFPDTQPSNIDFLAEIKALKGLLIFCGESSWDSLMYAAGYVQKLLVLNHCGELSEIELESLISGDEEKFIKKNKSLPMMSIHVPSFQYAQRRGDLSLGVMKQIYTNLGSLRKTKVKEHPLFEEDKELNVFRWKGAVESFIWVRP